MTKPYRLSDAHLRLDATLVRIDTEDGRSGWGEGCPWGHTTGLGVAPDEDILGQPVAVYE